MIEFEQGSSVEYRGLLIWSTVPTIFISHFITRKFPSLWSVEHFVLKLRCLSGIGTNFHSPRQQQQQQVQESRRREAAVVSFFS
jgi:hypothetical protein